MRKVDEGFVLWQGHRTYYRSVGEGDVSKAPLLLLHGGPGSTHNYFEVLDKLADSGRRIVSYDQIGCGNSFVDGCHELWCLETWLEELEAVRSQLGLTRLHVLGQSWGGMLIIAWLVDRKPQGVCSAILSSTLSSSRLWSKEQHRLISFMPMDEQEAIARAERTGNYDEAYQRANDHYTLLHACSPAGPDSPECLRRKKLFGTESYVDAWGPNEYTPTGTLRDFDYTDRLGTISQPCLIVSGTNDECTPLVAKTMADRIPTCRWELLDGARHMTFVDQTDNYCQMLDKWLKEHDC